MKNTTLLMILVLFALRESKAQSEVTPDLIYKKNHTILEAIIDSIYAGSIQYKLYAVPNGNTRKISLKQVSKIKLSNGDIHEIVDGKISSTTESQKVTATTQDTLKKEALSEVQTEKVNTITEQEKTTEIQPERTAAEVEPEQDKIARQKTVVPQEFRMVSVSAGGEFLYYPGFMNKPWAEKEFGFALDYAYGASLRFDFRPIKLAALSVNAGFSAFELDRRFRPEEDLIQDPLYSEIQTFTQIPLSGGLKFFLKKGFYLMPEAGITLIKTKVTTSPDHPASDLKESYTTKPISYAMNAGVEINTKWPIYFDISFKYQYLNVKNFSVGSLSQFYNKPLNAATVRIGIGFRAK